MPISWKRLRSVLFILAVVVSVRDYRATLQASPWLCGDVCWSSDCETECYEDQMQFENGNSISCLDYGVYDTGQACCGDGQCNNGEDTGTCYDDCYVPEPPGPQMTILMNGSLNPTMPGWMFPGSPEYNALSSTYGTEPILRFWEENSLGEVTGSYSGIYVGGGRLADFINSLPAGDVNVVAHSHGGNVAIIATGMVNRQIQHLVELGTPVNEDLPRYVGGHGVRERCIASSWADEVQFGGASPFQIGAYFAWLYLGYEFGQAAFDALAQDDEEGYWIFVGLQAFAFWQASEWWASTKIEWTGTTVAYGGLEHHHMHEPIVWNSLPPWCKTQ